jgi:hypothetical protein
VAWTTGSRLALAAVLAASAGLLLWLGARQFVSYDGFWHVFIARQDAWPNFWREVGDNAHPPLYYLLLGVAIDTLGPSFLGYRAISIVATLGSTLLVARIVAKLTASPWFGVVGAAAFGLSFNAVEVGLEVRAYALCVCLVLAAFSAYLDWLGTHPARLRSATRVLFAGALATAVATNYSAFFFLAAALATPWLLGVSHGRWRHRLFEEVRQHRLAAGLTFAVPLAAAAVSYGLHVRMWASRLSHVPSFMYDPAHETVGEFVAHASRSLVLLALPALSRAGNLQAGIAAALAVGALAWLVSRRARGRLAVVPPIVLGVMLALNLVAAVAGRYPFGGELRHEIYLFPFALIALCAGIDTVRRRVSLPWSDRRAWVGAAALGVAASTWMWTSTFRVVPESLMQAQMDTFRAAFGTPRAVLVDQFNFIMFFDHYHDWDWRLDWQDPGRSPWQIWRASKGGSHIAVCRSQQWQLDFSKPETFGDVAGCVRRAGPVAVFRPQQPGLPATWRVSDTPDLVKRLGPAAGVTSTGATVHGEDVFVAFEAAAPAPGGHAISVVEATYGANCGARPGNATALVRSDCDGLASCVFRVEVSDVGDPAPGCSKDFSVAWTCGAGGAQRRAAIGPEAGFGSSALLACGP